MNAFNTAAVAFEQIETPSADSLFLSRVKKTLGVTALRYSCEEPINQFANDIMREVEKATAQGLTTLSKEELVLQAILMMNAQEFLIIEPPLVIRQTISKLKKERAIQ